MRDCNKAKKLISVCMRAVNRDGSLTLPWGSRPLIKADNLYEEVAPHFKQLTSDELKSIYLELCSFMQDENHYQGCMLRYQAIYELNTRGIFFNAVEHSFN